MIWYQLPLSTRTINTKQKEPDWDQPSPVGMLELKKLANILGCHKYHYSFPCFCYYCCFVIISDLCITPLGMESGAITDAMISASSEGRYDSHKANTARLRSTTGSWLPTTTGFSMGNQWIQVAFDDLKLVSGVILQGRFIHTQWVTAFKIRYYNDVVWKNITDASGDDRVRE